MEEGLFFYTDSYLESLIIQKNIMLLCFLCSKWIYCINMLKNNAKIKCIGLFAQLYFYEKDSFSSNLNDGQKRSFKI